MNSTPKMIVKNQVISQPDKLPGVIIVFLLINKDKISRFLYWSTKNWLQIQILSITTTLIHSASEHRYIDEARTGGNILSLLYCIP